MTVILKRHARKTIVSLVVLITSVLLLSACGTSPDRVDEEVTQQLTNKKMVVYHSPSCGCCGNYVDYLKANGLNVSAVKRSNVKPIKMEHGLSRETWSCHTTIIGDYVVEGHVPIEAVAKLIREKPDITGITIPGMPQHAPGMGEPIGEKLRVASIDNRGKLSSTFTTIDY